MKTKFPCTFSTSFEDFWTNACKTLPTKGCHELRDAFQFLLIWQSHFQAMHGVIQAITHLNGSDDPPDVIAHFASREVYIEITTIDPAHIRQSDVLHAKTRPYQGRNEIPITVSPRNKAEALKMMYSPESSPWEDIVDRNQIWFNSITERVKRKLGTKGFKDMPPGIILLPGKIDGLLGEVCAVEHAFSSIRANIPEARDWTVAVCRQRNSHDYFSAISDPF